MNFNHRGNCGCPKQIVHPTRHKCVHCCTENVVEHVHPVHTTVVNHHLERNRHVFPHSTSVKNDPKCVDEFGGSCQMPTNQNVGCNKGNCGGGMMHGGFNGHGHPNPYHGNNHGHQHGHHYPDQGNHWGNHHPGKMNNWKKPNNWC